LFDDKENIIDVVIFFIKTGAKKGIYAITITNPLLCKIECKHNGNEDWLEPNTASSEIFFKYIMAFEEITKKDVNKELKNDNKNNPYYIPFLFDISLFKGILFSENKRTSTLIWSNYVILDIEWIRFYVLYMLNSSLYIEIYIV